MSTPVKIDIWSDIACPWCYIGKRNLEAGIAASDVPVEIEYHSFELSPNSPEHYDGRSHAEVLAKHLGRTEQEASQMMDRVTAVAANAGLDYRYDLLKTVATVRAHELLHFAKEQGRQLALKERLLAAYFTEGRDLGELEELVALAADAGLDPDAARAALESHRYLDAVRADQAQARAYGITGVPFFVIDGRYGVSGAQPPEVFAEALARVAGEQVA